MKLLIRHTTRYTYTQPLLYSIQNMHLWPSGSDCQSVLEWNLRAPATLFAQRDGLGNLSHSFSLLARPERDLHELSIVATGTVLTHGVSDFVDEEGDRPPPAFYLRPTALAEPHPRMALWAVRAVPALMVARSRGETPSVDDLLALTRAVADKVRYRKGRTGVETTALEAFDWELGVCQDQAHVMVAVCRSIGLPARYVSGYFHADDEPELASHAWADVCIDPLAGRWISLDVTHRGLTDERHVRLAAATDYSACTPVRGLRRGGGEESMSVDVTVSVV
ncbi:MAG: transglutaminase family protein [Hydrogenophaga sp.]|nr:transglutaminase family protein [Hydrogenophaga sp.]